jgi:AraC family transcriptional regulator
VRPREVIGEGWGGGGAGRVETHAAPARASSRARGWEGIVLERHRFGPTDHVEAIYDEHVIGLVLEERARLAHAVDGRRYEGMYGRGDLIFTPCGRPVRWKVDEECEAAILTLRPELFHETARRMGMDPGQVRLVGEPRTRDPLILQIVHALLEALDEPSPGERLYVESLRDTLAIHLLRNYSSLQQRPTRRAGRGLPAAKLRRAIETIQDRLESGISLADLAGAASVSVSHFEVLFKRSTGLTPYQFVLHRRVDRAKQLLIDEDLSLVQVAARSGFCDQGHLARQFKRIVGVTPSEYRKGL